jgi:2',3'-cyclic-nucleotide 2'-phosphodiesterase (5'-nucleotidase family)
MLAIMVLGTALVWVCKDRWFAAPMRNAATPRSLKILVSGDTQGWIAPCGCTSNQSGGLLRRGTFVRQEQTRHNVVLFDVGGAPSGTSPYDRAKFEAILDGELLMGLAAHNLGGPEIALGSDYIQQLAAQKNIPFISANTTDSAGKPLADSHRIIRVENQRLAVVGVVSPRYATALCRVSEPQAAVLATRQALASQFDSLIVLAYLPEEELRSFAAALPEADVVIGGPTGQSISPTPIGPTILAAATNKGKFLIALSYSAESDERGWQGTAAEITADLADDEAQQKNLAKFRAALQSHDFAAEDSGLKGIAVHEMPMDLQVAGTAACIDCHPTESQSWQTSAHAHAWKTLTAQGTHVDSFCQQCHTTGFGWPGGFVSARRSANQVNVGCESCHGPAHQHAKDPSQRTPLAARETCSGCHDRENSPDFEFARFWPAIAHGKKQE